MASVTMLIGGALANALAFTGSSYLFSRLSKDNIDAERKRQDLAIKQLRKARYRKDNNELILSINNARLERKAETKFIELNDAMRDYKNFVS